MPYGTVTHDSAAGAELKKGLLQLTLNLKNGQVKLQGTCMKEWNHSVT